MVVMITREPVNQPAPTARSQWALAFQFFFSANQNHGNRDPWDGFVERGFYRVWNSPTEW